MDTDQFSSQGENKLENNKPRDNKPSSLDDAIQRMLNDRPGESYRIGFPIWTSLDTLCSYPSHCSWGYVPLPSSGDLDSRRPPHSLFRFNIAAHSLHFKPNSRTTSNKEHSTDATG